MTSRKGRTKRRAMPNPHLVEEPPLSVLCMCPHCEEMFPPAHIQGNYLQRRCPHCETLISVEDYDEKAQRVLELYEELRANLEAAQLSCEKMHRLVKWFAPAFLRPLRVLAERRLAKWEARTGSLQSQLGRLDARARMIAQDRYYASEWFASTHIPLQRKVVGPYKLKPFYDRDVRWQLPRGDAAISGMTAEFSVFEALLSHVTEPHSPLYGARIVPNVYFPRVSQRRESERLWDQVDCILLTRKAAFVIEVKRRFSHIISDVPFKKVYSCRSDNAEKLEDMRRAARGSVSDEGDSAKTSASVQLDSEPPSNSKSWTLSESRALTQNSTHALAFIDACDVYPYDLVYEQTVFVGCKSFESDSCDFFNNVNVSALEDASTPFIECIEREYAQLDDLIDQSQVDELAEMLIGTYGDLNQKRGILHAQRIAGFN